METKGLTCDIRPGRRPRGRALVEFVARKREAALSARRGAERTEPASVRET
jgi:formate dehydrogenase major subunit